MHPVVRGERGGHLSERRTGPDDRVQPPGPHPLGEVRQPEPVWFDDEEDRPAVGGPYPRRADDRNERSARAYQRGRAFEDLTADHVERDVDLAGVLELAGLQVDERVRA